MIKNIGVSNLTPAQAKARHEELAAEIRRHDHLYYVLARPVISDQAYYLVHPERKADLYKVCVFREWLLGRCRKEAEVR